MRSGAESARERGQLYLMRIIQPVEEQITEVNECSYILCEKRRSGNHKIEVAISDMITL
jgi:hypothetical protein